MVDMFHPGGRGDEMNQIRDSLNQCFGETFRKNSEDYPPHSFRDLYDVYRGRSVHLTKTVFQTVFKQVHWLNSKILPLALVPGVGTITKQRFEMHEAVMHHQVTQTPARLASATKTEITSEKRRYALAIKIIHDIIETAGAAEYIDAQTRQLIYAIWHLLAERAMVALLCVLQPVINFAPEVADSGPSNRLGESMDERFMFASINKNPNAIRYLLEEAKHRLKARRTMSDQTHLPSTMIFPAGSFAVCSSRPEYQYYMLNGVGPWSPKKVVPKGTTLTLTESVRFSTDQTYDPAYRVAAIGGYFTMGFMHVRNVPRGFLTPQHMATRIYSESLDNYHDITLTNMLRYCGLFGFDFGPADPDDPEEEYRADDDDDFFGDLRLAAAGLRFFSSFQVRLVGGGGGEAEAGDPAEVAPPPPTWGKFFDHHRVHGDGKKGSGISAMLELYALPEGCASKQARVSGILAEVHVNNGGEAQAADAERPDGFGGGFFNEENVRRADQKDEKEGKEGEGSEGGDFELGGGPEEQLEPEEESDLKKLAVVLDDLPIQGHEWLIGVLYRHGVWCGLSFVGIRPNKKYYMGSAVYACNKGVVGRTLVGDLDTLIGNDASRKIHLVHTSLTAGTIIERPEAVVVLDNVLCMQYYGGNDHCFRNMSSSLYLEKWKGSLGRSSAFSIFAVPQPFRTGTPSTYYFNAEKFDGFSYKTHLETMWGSDPSETLFDAFESAPGTEKRRFKPDEIYGCTRHLYQEKQFVSDQSKEARISREIRNRGHWGTAVYPGCAAGRIGKGILQTDNDLNKVLVPN